MTNDCKTCPVSTGTHKPAEALHQKIAEPQPTALGYADAISAGLSYTAPHILALAADELRAQHARIAELESQVQRAAEIERAAILLRVKNRAVAGALLVEDFRSLIADRGPAAQGLEQDAARWRMAALISRETMTHPDKRTAADAVAAYRRAVHSGLDIQGAIDAALAAQAKQGGAA